MARAASATRDLGSRRFRRGGGDGGGGGTMIGDGRCLRGGLPRSHMGPAARWDWAGMGWRSAAAGGGWEE